MVLLVTVTFISLRYLTDTNHALADQVKCHLSAFCYSLINISVLLRSRTLFINITGSTFTGIQ